jgi:hypothetical protein
MVVRETTKLPKAYKIERAEKGELPEPLEPIRDFEFDTLPDTDPRCSFFDL